MKIIFIPPARDKLFEDKGIFTRIHISDLGEVTSFEYGNFDEALTAYFGAYEAQVRKEGFPEKEEPDGINLNTSNQSAMFKIYEHDFKELCLKARKKENIDNNAKSYESGAYWAMLGIYDAFDLGMLPKENGENLKQAVFSQYTTLRKTVEALTASDRKKNELRIILSERVNTVVKESKTCSDEDLIDILLGIVEACLEESVTVGVIRKNRKELKYGTA